MFFKQKKGQQLFLGEGPWVHVPVEHEMSGDGVGQNFDGASGVVVDSDPWTKEAQVRVFKKKKLNPKSRLLRPELTLRGRHAPTYTHTCMLLPIHILNILFSLTYAI